MLPANPAVRAQIWRSILFPSIGEMIFWLVMAGLGRYVCGESWWGVSKFVGCCFLLPHIAVTALFGAELRWPKFFERFYRPFKNPLVIAALVTAILAYWLVVAGGWQQAVAFRPDWRGALFVLAFGGAFIIAVWPPYWVYSRFIKPWVIRTNGHFAGFLAITSVALLYWGTWMAGIIIWVSRG